MNNEILLAKLHFYGL